MKKRYVVSAIITMFIIGGAAYFAQSSAPSMEQEFAASSQRAKTQAEQTQRETTAQSQISLNTPTVMNHTEEVIAINDTPVAATDDDIPPIGKPVENATYQGDLDDYDSYQAFGDNQEKKLKQQFIIAAKSKVARLEALLERGKKEGISQAELTFAEEKIAGIKAMSEQLQQQLDAQ